MLMDIFDTGPFQEGKGRMQSVDTRDVLGTGFKFIRQKVRLHLRVGNAAGAAGDQRDHLLRNLVADQKSADSLWTQQAFVSGEGEYINVHLFHVDGEGTRCLCRIQNKGQTVLLHSCPTCSTGIRVPQTLEACSISTALVFGRIIPSI